MSELDTPVDHFAGCHVGIVAQLHQLSALPALLAPAQLARRSAEQALAFFNKGMLAHHSEEEQDLFPAVLASAAPGAEREQVKGLIAQLTLEHRTLEQMWQSLVPDLKRVAKGQDAQLSEYTLTQLVTRYRAHAALEEREFLPLAQSILGRNDHHMAALGLSLHMRHVPAFVGHL